MPERQATMPDTDDAAGAGPRPQRPSSWREAQSDQRTCNIGSAEAQIQPPSGTHVDLSPSSPSTLRRIIGTGSTPLINFNVIASPQLGSAALKVWAVVITGN